MKSAVFFLLVIVAAVSATETDVIIQDVANFDVSNSDVVNSEVVIESDVVIPDVAIPDVAIPDVATDTRDSRQNGISLGVIGNSRLLRSFILTRSALVSSQALNVRYTAPAGVRLTAVRAREVGVSQFASVRRIAGGIGSNFVTLQFVNSPRRGFHFTVQIYGR